MFFCIFLVLRHYFAYSFHFADNNSRLPDNPMCNPLPLALVAVIIHVNYCMYILPRSLRSQTLPDDNLDLYNHFSGKIFFDCLVHFLRL